MPDKNRIARWLDHSIAMVDTVVDDINADVDHATYGLAALKALLDTLDTVADDIQAKTALLPADPASQSSVETAIGTAESNIRGADSDTLKTLSDQLDTLQSTAEGIQNNTRFTAAVPLYMQRPAADSEAYRMAANLYDTGGAMEDPANSEILVRLLQDDGTAITSELFKENALTNGLDNPTDDTNFPAASGWRAMEREATGNYFLFYSVDNDATEESLTVEFGWDEGGSIVFQSRSTLISDATNDLNAILTDTADMQPKLGTPVTTISGDIATVGGNVDTIKNEVQDGAYGLSALKTAIDNVDSGNTELVGETSTATHNIEVADGTSEVSVATFSPSKNGKFAVQFDVSALEDAGEGGTVTIRLKSKLDGTNLRTIDKSSCIVGTDEMMPGVEDTVFKGTDIVEATIRCSSAVTAQRAVPYRVVEFS